MPTMEETAAVLPRTPKPETEVPCKFRPGDLVQLKSGSPPFAVAGSEKQGPDRGGNYTHQVTVAYWDSDKGLVVKFELKEALLEKANRPATPAK